MRRSGWALALMCALSLLGVIHEPAAGAADSVMFRQVAGPAATDRIIVKWRADGVAALQIPTIEGRAAHLRSVAAVDIHPVRNLFARTDVMRLNYPPSAAELQDILGRLNADPAVQYAEADGYRYVSQFPATTQTPNDPNFVAGSDDNGNWDGQWYLLPSSTATPSAIDATTAWQTTIGSPNVVVAVIDTGIIEDHPDFLYPAGASSTPKLQCNTGSADTTACGYDFVSCDQGNLTSDSGSDTTADCSASGSAATYYFAVEPHGWQADAADPGDWISSAETAMSLYQDAGCTTTESSSWHGTKVAGVIGAVTNNGIGIAGIAPLTTILPVRAIGSCSGRVSDIAAAILWAAGIGVTVDAGTIASSPAANIINLSLAGASPCSQTEQDAINQATAAGVLVVVAAGNEGGPLDAPANCSGVLSVVGLRASGVKVPYSNVSSSAAAATLAAPGGNCINSNPSSGPPTVGISVPCVYNIETTTDAGATLPSSTPGFYTYTQLNQSFINAGGNPDNAAVVGTSFAAPMVASVAALMLAAQPNLSPSQLIARMQSSALPFPSSDSTTSTSCAEPSDTTNSNGQYTDTSQFIACVCTKSTCGAGMVNAAAAVLAAQGMFVEIQASSSTGTLGQHIRLDGSGTTAATGHTITSWQWSTIPATSDQLIDPNSPVATLVVPSLHSIEVMLTVTDDAGHSASETTEIESALGGVGSLDPLLLASLAVCALAAWRRRYRLH